MGSAGSDTIIACNLAALSPAERARRSELAGTIEKSAKGVTESELGYRVELPDDPRICERALELILLERRCCPFLSLDLSFAPGDGAVRLGIAGPPGVKEFLRDNGILGCARVSRGSDCC